MREDDDVDDLSDLPRLTWTILKETEGRPAAEVAAELSRRLPERSSLEVRPGYRRDPVAEEANGFMFEVNVPAPSRTVYLLNDVQISEGLFSELSAIIRGRQQHECEAEGHRLPARRCRCGQVSEPGT